MVKLGVRSMNTTTLSWHAQYVLWIGDPPDPELHLNKDSCTGMSMHLEYFRPLCWARFGGPGGSYLPFLMEIHVMYHNSLVNFSGIRFHYKDDKVPTGRLQFGNCARTERTRIFTFVIDGSGGAVIESVEAPAVQALDQGFYDEFLDMITILSYNNPFLSFLFFPLSSFV